MHEIPLCSILNNPMDEAGIYVRVPDGRWDSKMYF
jgi:hypothetical protein